MRAQTSLFVSLSGGFDPAGHRGLFEADVAADSSHYGLDQLQRHGYDVRFRGVPADGVLKRDLRSKLASWSGGYDVLSLFEDRALRRTSDCILCWTEGTSVPLATRALLRLERAPIITGIIWLSDVPPSRSRAYNRLFENVLHRLTGIFVLSRPQRDILINRWHLHPDRVRYIPFGIATEQWAQLENGIRQDSDLIVSAGNDPDRDFPTLIDAARLALAGLPSGRKGELEILTSRFEGIVPAGLGSAHVSHGVRATRQAYARSAFVVVPTRPNSHASGVTVVLEAMAQRRAVIASACPGLDDYIIHGETGFLVDPGQPRQLAERMAWLLEHPDRAAAMGQRGYAKVMSEHSSAVMVERIAVFIREMLDGPKPD